DVFVHDRLKGTTERVSVASGGAEGNADSGFPAISPDGRFVAFSSNATNLLGVGGDTNGFSDVFVHDRETGTTERVDVGPGGAAANEFLCCAAIPPDGRFVAFNTNADNLLGPGGDSNGFGDVFVRGLDPADPLGVDASLFPDGQLDDTVLEVVDATTGA